MKEFFIMILIAIGISTEPCDTVQKASPEVVIDYTVENVPPVMPIQTVSPTPTIQVTPIPKPIKEKKIKNETEVTDKEYDLLSAIVMAEAENQNDKAQYMVACVVLNRVKSDLFPNTIEDVIYEKYQFSPVRDGRLSEVMQEKISTRVYKAVKKALQKNTLPSDVLYFTSCGYLNGTIPYDTVDDMNFSRQK